VVGSCYLPCGLLNEEEVANLGSGSLYDLLAPRGRAPVSREQSIEAALLNLGKQPCSRSAPGRPVLRFERLCFDAKG
jgi:DNA-binding GntR family transcriptional regulator